MRRSEATSPSMEALRLVREFLFPDSVASHAIPSLDGGFVPNEALEDAAVLVEVEGPDDALFTPDGALVVSAGNEVLRFSGGAFARRETFATLPGAAGALALEPSGALLVCCAGAGLLRIAAGGATSIVAERAGAAPLRCLTSVAVAADGTIVATDGSRTRQADEWVWDLMEKNASGRVVAIERDGARVVADGLAWPSGIAFGRDGRVIVAEAWRHAVHRLPLGGGARETIAENMAGYPARLAPAADGGLWVAFFALRTHLVEFVLEQDDFRAEMMRTIDPRWWIRPDLRTINSGLVPLQGGGIRKLGRVKPWAPPRSYGLVALLDDEGEARTSLHSRAGGRNHGVVAARPQADGSLLMVSKGGDRVLRATGSPSPGGLAADLSPKGRGGDAP